MGDREVGGELLSRCLGGMYRIWISDGRLKTGDEG